MLAGYGLRLHTLTQQQQQQTFFARTGREIALAGDGGDKREAVMTRTSSSEGGNSEPLQESPLSALAEPPLQHMWFLHQDPRG